MARGILSAGVFAFSFLLVFPFFFPPVYAATGNMTISGDGVYQLPSGWYSCRMPIGPGPARCPITVSWNTTGANNPYLYYGDGSSISTSPSTSLSALMDSSGRSYVSPTVLWISYNAGSIYLKDASGGQFDVKYAKAECVPEGRYLGSRCLSHPSCSLPWGGSIQNGQKITLYSQRYAISPIRCEQHTLKYETTCVDGGFTGGFGNFPEDYDSLSTSGGWGPTCSNADAFLVGEPLTRADTPTNRSSESYCEIQEGKSNCTVLVKWTTTGLPDAVNVFLSDKWYLPRTLLGSGFNNASGVPVALSNGEAKFLYLYAQMPHDAEAREIDRMYVGGSCASGTSWDFGVGKCLVPASCGTAYGQSYSSAPTANLCGVGSTAGSVDSITGGWGWNCTRGPSVVSCSAKELTAEDAVCGNNRNTFSSTVTAWPFATHSAFCQKGNLSGWPTVPTFPSAKGNVTWNCLGKYGGVNRSCTANVLPPPPVITFTASPSSVVLGGSSTLSWSATDATECTATGDWSGPKAVSGTQSNLINLLQNYTISCTGPGGTQSKAVSVSLSPQLAVCSSGSRIALGSGVALARSIDVGQYEDLKVYYDGFPDCLGTDISDSAVSGTNSPSNSISVSPGSPARITGLSGGSENITVSEDGKSITIPYTVSDPRMVICPDVSSISIGDTFPLTARFWNNLAVTPDCETLGFSDKTSNVTWTSDASSIASVSNATGQKGFVTGVALGTVDISATYNGVNATKNLDVREPEPNLSLTADPPSVYGGEDVVLHWVSSHSNNCTASGDWSGTKSLSGTETMTHLDRTKTYTLTCVGPGGSITKSVTVPVDRFRFLPF